MLYYKLGNPHQLSTMEDQNFFHTNMKEIGINFSKVLIIILIILAGTYSNCKISFYLEICVLNLRQSDNQIRIKRNYVACSSVSRKFIGLPSSLKIYFHFILDLFEVSKSRRGEPCDQSNILRLLLRLSVISNGKLL